MDSEKTTKAKCKPGTFLVIILVICAFIAGIGGSVIASFYVFPALAEMPRFQKYLEISESGQTIFKLIEKEKEIVSEDSVFFDAITSNQPSLVTVVVRNPGSRLAETIGTGFIVSADGLIVTNKHFVLDNAGKVKIIRDDYSVSDAEVVARDPLNDLALLKIEGDNLPVANLYPAEEIELGQRVLALGNKYEKHENYASFGILGAINKGVLAYQETNISRLEGLLETDATISAANSGGPLIDLNGEIIGLCSYQGGNSTTGYAIPVSLVRSAIDSYVADGQIVRSTLGVNWQTVTPGMAQIDNLDRWEGALLVASEDVPAVTPGGPAAQVGLRAGDIIWKIEGREINLDNGFMRMLQEYKPGDEIEITYVRNNEEKTVKVRVGESR